MKNASNKERLEMLHHNLLCYSANYLMNEPKAGYEKQFAETLSEIKKLENEK